MLNSGIYIHVPFCRKKCLYCDFFSGGEAAADWRAFASAVKSEFDVRQHELLSPPDTLYIGGGTPSILPLDMFRDILSSIMEKSFISDSDMEITMEVNPDDVNLFNAKEWKSAGITRISMGVQSFVDSELNGIGRKHNSEKAIAAFEILREFFDNISLDLMFGLPGQTIESWQYSVGRAVELSPEHLSAYSLMFEEGTPFTVLRDKGRLSFPDDACNMEMWKFLSDTLVENGFSQYEISNYCKAGFESKHNSKYWKQAPYLGLGPSAHSYDGGRIRRFNPADIKGYIKYYNNSKERAGVFYDEEKLNEEELSDEYILTRMRMKEGINFEEYRKRFGEEKCKRLYGNAIKIMDGGLICLDGKSVSLSKQGIMVSDSVITELAM
ncbi:MAG: radical SAM family heme chaperone HemW [Muribaculaceae bacterium]|nr:radical SAM family heme chaperone HemW [Muribaculaceae bacterium]